MKMKHIVHEVGESTRITIKTHGDLFLAGGDQTRLDAWVKNSRTLIVQTTPEGMHLTSLDDCRLVLPAGAQVLVEMVGGDAHIKDLRAELDLRHVGGDLELQQCHNVTIGQVGGDCMLEKVTGILKIERIGGDLDALDVQEVALFGSVGGDVCLLGITTGLKLSAGGDARLILGPILKEPVFLNAGGDISLFVAAGLNAMANLASGGRDIRIRLGGQRERVEKPAFQVKLGEGGVAVNVTAAGDILLTDEKWEDDDFREHFKDLNESWQDMEEDFAEDEDEDEDEEEEGRGMNFSFDFDSKDFEDKVNRRVQEAMSHAQERIQHAMRKMEQKMSSMDGLGLVINLSGSASKAAGVGVSVSKEEPVSAPRPAGGISEEERLLVLKMLQEKKITAEEADKLLESLQGEE
jgi:hypothetical protein